MAKKRHTTDLYPRAPKGGSPPAAKPTEAPEARRNLGRQARVWLLVTLAVLVAAFFAVGFYRAKAGPGYPLDDTWIHLAFARNVASGLGFGANPHEPTPGATSPLWVFLLAPGFLFGAVHDTWPWILATLVLASAGVLGSALFASIVRRTTRGSKPPPLGAAILCGVTIAWTAPLVWSTAGAMEVSLFAALILATLLVFTMRRSSGWRGGLAWGALAGAASLARPEGLLLAPLLAVISLRPRSRKATTEAAAGLAACAVVYSPSVIFCLATSGYVFPNTFYAKTTALVAGAPDLRFLAGVVRLVFELSPVSFFALVLGIAAAVFAMSKRLELRGVLAAAGFAVGLPLAYAVMGRTYLFAPFAGNFGRYLYPILPVALVLGFWAVTLALREARRRPAVVAGVALLALAPLLAVFGTIQKVGLYRQNVHDVNTMQVAMARAVESKFTPRDLIAANDVGALAYFTEFRVLDLVGIVSTETLRALKPAGMDPRARARAHAALLLEERPAGLVVFPQWFEATLAWLGPVAERVETITDRTNITSPYPTLVAYRLSWPDDQHAPTHR